MVTKRQPFGKKLLIPLTQLLFCNSRSCLVVLEIMAGLGQTITQTRLFNILQNFMAVKMIIFR